MKREYSMKVVFITHYPALYGANRSLLNLIDGLTKYKVEPFVISIIYRLKSQLFITSSDICADNSALIAVTLFLSSNINSTLSGLSQCFFNCLSRHSSASAILSSNLIKFSLIAIVNWG